MAIKKGSGQMIFNPAPSEKLEAGDVIGRMNLPLVYKGDALFHVAGFDDSVAVSESLDDFKEEIGESLPSLTSG